MDLENTTIQVFLVFHYAVFKSTPKLAFASWADVNVSEKLAIYIYIYIAFINFTVSKTGEDC